MSDLPFPTGIWNFVVASGASTPVSSDFVGF